MGKMGIIQSPMTCKGGGFPRAGIAVLALLTLAACAPDLGNMPQTKPAASYETARSFTAPTGAWPSDDWWKAYGDPQLDQLIEEALAGSPAMSMTGRILIPGKRARTRLQPSNRSSTFDWPGMP